MFCSIGQAYACIMGSGRVVTWGNVRDGGDSSAVQGELKDQTKPLLTPCSPSTSTKGAFCSSAGERSSGDVGRCSL